MKRPGGSTLLLGHPVVAVPLILGGLGVLWACWQRGSDGIAPAIMVLICLAPVFHASEQVSHYRAWKRAWDGMGGAAARSPQRWRRVGGVALLAVLGVNWAGKLDGEQVRIGIAIGVGTLALVLLWLGARWTSRRMRRGRRRTCVAIAVGAPLMRVPRLAQAYRALPDYCQLVLAGRAP